MSCYPYLSCPLRAMVTGTPDGTYGHSLHNLPRWLVARRWMNDVACELCCRIL